MISFTHNLLAFFHVSKYALVFLGTFAEGPVVVMTSGFLLRIGQFSLIPLFAALFFGNFFADLCWYWIGKYGAEKAVRRFGKFLKVTPGLVARMENRFNNHGEKIVLLAKLTTTLAIPVFLAAGMLRMPLKKFVSTVLAGGIAWTAVMLYLGFAFGNAYNLVPSVYKYPFLILIFILVVLILHYAKKYSMKKEMVGQKTP